MSDARFATRDTGDVHLEPRMFQGDVREMRLVKSSQCAMRA